MEKFDWKTYLIACMRLTPYCCLATVDDAGVWSNPVYFACDGQFNLYFISQPHSRHMQNLTKDPRISVSIFSTAQDTFGDVAGIQLSGKAKFLTDPKEVRAAQTLYFKRRYENRGGYDPADTRDEYVNNSEWIFVKITPERLYCFDTKFFGEERQKVPKKIYA